MVATEVANLIRKHRNAKVVFNIALRDIVGFKDLYALRSNALRPVDRFTMAYNEDVKHWVSLGHKKEFEGARFSRYRTQLNALAPVVTEALVLGDDDPTEESSEYDEEDVKDDLERLSTKRERLHKELQETNKEFDRLNEKKARHEARKRLEEIEAQKATLAEEEEKLRQVIKKSK